FARRAFRSVFVGTLAGLLCAVHPFWVFNTAELNDGVLASFLLAACLMLGARGCQTGEAFTSLLYGLALAALALVRAALLPSPWWPCSGTCSAAAASAAAGCAPCWRSSASPTAWPRGRCATTRRSTTSSPSPTRCICTCGSATTRRPRGGRRRSRR